MRWDHGVEIFWIAKWKEIQELLKIFFIQPKYKNCGSRATLTTRVLPAYYVFHLFLSLDYFTFSLYINFHILSQNQFDSSSIKKLLNHWQRFCVFEDAPLALNFFMRRYFFVQGKIENEKNPRYHKAELLSPFVNFHSITCNMYKISLK